MTEQWKPARGFLLETPSQRLEPKSPALLAIEEKQREIAHGTSFHRRLAPILHWNNRRVKP